MEPKPIQSQPTPQTSDSIQDQQPISNVQTPVQPPTVPENTVPPTSIPPKRHIWKYVLIIIAVLVFIVIAFVGFIVVKNTSVKVHLNTNTTTDNLASSPPSDCIPLSAGLKKSAGTSALFLQEPEKRGYEGIVRKSTQNGKVIFDIVTNQLPDSGVPYLVWIAYPNTSGKICGGTKLDPMTQDPTTKTWQASFDDSVYKDDANVILITSGKLDTPDGNLHSMNDIHVILRGFFGQTDYVTETK